jgi:hypothetical protein
VLELEKAREQEIFPREGTPTEQCVLAGFLYYAGYRFVESNRSWACVTSPFTIGITG